MNSAARLQISLACGDYDINRGLIGGTVRSEGIELVPIAPPSPERHWRMMAPEAFFFPPSLATMPVGYV